MYIATIPTKNINWNDRSTYAPLLPSAVYSENEDGESQDMNVKYAGFIFRMRGANVVWHNANWIRPPYEAGTLHRDGLLQNVGGEWVKEKLESFNLCGDIVVQYGNAGETPSRFWPLLVGEDEWCFLSGSCDWLIAAGVEALIQAEERGNETIDPDGLLLRLGAEIGKLDRRSTGRQQQRYKMLASLHLLARLGQLDNALHTHNPRRFHFLRWRDGKVKDVIAHHRPGEGIPHYGFDRRRRFRGFESISFAAAGAPLPTGWSVAFSPGPCRCPAAADGSTTEASRRRCPIHGTDGLPAVPSPRTFDELIRIMRNGGDID